MPGWRARTHCREDKKAVVFADSIKMSTYLVAFIVGEFEATEPVMVGNAPLRVCAVPGKKHLATFAVDIGKASLEHFSRLLRDSLSRRQIGFDRDSRLCLRRDGKSRRDNLSRNGAAGRCRPSDAHRARAGGGRGVARKCPYVVRRSGDDEMVERAVVERGIRDFHGNARGGRLEARVAPLGQLHRIARRGHAGRRIEKHAAYRIPRRTTRRGGRHVRHFNLREGCIGAAHARAVFRRRSVSRRDSALSAPACLCQRRDHRSVGRSRRVDERAGASADGHVDFSSRLSVDQRRAKGRVVCA